MEESKSIAVMNITTFLTLESSVPSFLPAGYIILQDNGLCCSQVFAGVPAF